MADAALHVSGSCCRALSCRNPWCCDPCLQVMRIADCGAEICRITVQGKKEADACEAIKNKLVQLK